MVRQGLFEPVQPGGVTNASPEMLSREERGQGQQRWYCFFFKVSKNDRRTYLTNFIAVSKSNGHKTKLNSNSVLALSLS